jgi:hypothetical protein
MFVIGFPRQHKYSVRPFFLFWLTDLAAKRVIIGCERGDGPREPRRRQS